MTRETEAEEEKLNNQKIERQSGEILLFIMSFVMGIIIARFFDGKIVVYSIVVVLLAAFLLGYYSSGFNCRPFGVLLIIIILNVLGFLLYCVDWFDVVYEVEYFGEKCLEIRKLSSSDFMICFGILISLILLVILVRGYRYCWSKHKKSMLPSEEEKALFREREENLKLIKNYLVLFKMVCVDGDWGQGKTFLMNQLRIRNSDNYEFVRMKTITYDVNMVLNYIVNELKSVLDKYRILPEQILLLQNLSSKNDSIGILAGIFCKEKSTYNILEDLHIDLTKIEKQIVIIFEDIDRISDFNTLAKILAVAETLTDISSKIKVVFECDYEILHLLVGEHYVGIRKHHLVDMYLEKYFSHRVKLTKIDLQSVMIGLYLDGKIEGGGDKFKRLKKTVLKCISDVTYVQSRNAMQSYLFKRKFPIRPIKKCMDEIEGCLKEMYWENNELEYIVVLTYVLKYFDSDIYSEFEETNNIFLVLTKDVYGNVAGVNSKHYEDVLNKIADINNRRIGVNDDVLYRLDILQRYKYDMNSYEVLSLVGVIPDTERDRANAFYTDADKLERTYNNYKINWGVNHIIDSGYPLINDVEKIVGLFCDDVLDLNQSEWKDKFKQLWLYLNDMSIKSDTGNSTIFLQGVPSEIILSRAMRVCKCTYDKWLRFIDFYFDSGIFRQDDVLDYTTIVVLRMCVKAQKSSKNERIVFLHTVEKFLSLKADGNFNKYQVYWEFLSSSIEVTKYYVSGHYAAGDIAFNRGLDTDEQVNEHIRQVRQILKGHKIELENAKKIFKGKDTEDEISLLIKFVERNIEIIEMDKVVDVSYGSIRTNVTWDHELEDLINSASSEEAINQEGFNRVKSEDWLPGKMVLLCEEIERRKKMRLKLLQYKNTGGKSGIKAYCIGQDDIMILFKGNILYTYMKEKIGNEKFKLMVEKAKDGFGLNECINREVRGEYSDKKQLSVLDFEIEE